MPDTPLVTVITPTYNRGDTYLRETIDSVLAQDYANMEYIVLDDGSADNTVELLQSYDDSRLRWESHANMGVIRTVNKGFSMATGEYVTVVNSDDPLLPDYLPKAVAFMDAHPTVQVAYPNWRWIDGDGNTVRNVQPPDYNLADMVRWHYCLPGPGTLLRRSLFDEVDTYDSTYPTIFDFEFYIRLSLHGERHRRQALARIPETLATYREHGTTITRSSRGTAIADEHIRLIEWVYEQQNLPEALLAVRNEALSTAHYMAGLKCLPNAREAARKHFWQALRLCPTCTYPHHGGALKSWFHMLRVILLPDALRRVFRREGSQQ